MKTFPASSLSFSTCLFVTAKTPLLPRRQSANLLLTFMCVFHLCRIPTECSATVKLWVIPDSSLNTQSLKCCQEVQVLSQFSGSQDVGQVLTTVSPSILRLSVSTLVSSDYPECIAYFEIVLKTISAQRHKQTHNGDSELRHLLVGVRGKGLFSVICLIKPCSKHKG